MQAKKNLHKALLRLKKRAAGHFLHRDVDLISEKIRIVENDIRNKDPSIVKKETIEEAVLGESVLNERHFFDRSLTPNTRRPQSRPRSRSAVELERQPGDTWRRRGVLLNPIWDTKTCQQKNIRKSSSNQGRLSGIKEYLSRPLSAVSRPGSATMTFNTARDVWTRDLRVEEEEIEPPTPEYEDFLDLANQSLESKEYEQALNACDNAIAIRPDVSIAYRQKAVVLRKLGRFEESVNTFRKSFRAPTSDDAVLKKKRDEEVPICMIRLLCKGAKATRRCNSCGLHDDDYGFVDYCDECFEVRHKPYSIQHDFLYLGNTFKKLEQWDDEYKESILCHRMNRFHEIKRNVHEIKKTIRKDPSSSFDTIENAVERCVDLRSRVAVIRDRIARQLLGEYSEEEEEESESESEKEEEKKEEEEEKELEEEEIELDPRVRALIHRIESMSLRKRMRLEQRAKHIQSLYKIHKSRKAFRAEMKRVYRKYYDASTGPFGKLYYFNIKSRRTQWRRPLWLTKCGTDIALDPSHVEAYNAGKIRAATRMQNLYRSRKAWRRLNKIARDIYVKFYDSSTDRFYFYNPRTKTSLWKKPKLLGRFDASLSKNSERPKIYAKDLDENDAASMLQSLYRKRMARRRVLKLVESLYVRVKDETTGRYYYFNKSSGRSTWNAPFGATNIHDLTKNERVHIESGNIDDDDDDADIATKAAVRLQAIWRGHHERNRVHDLVERIFEKVFDQSSGKYFYFNTMTNTSHWEKPRLMRYHQEIDSAIRIQSVWRGCLARSKISKVLESVYEKSIDNESGREFYFNKLTNTSRWTRPAFVRRG